MYLVFLILSLLSGMTIGIQGVIVSVGANAIGLPAMLSFFSIVQAVPALIYIFIKKPSLGIVGSLVSGWKWFLVSGLFSATIVTIMTLSISKIGALTAFVLVVLGQIIASPIADHFGLLGIEVKPMNRAKFASIMVIIAGVTLLVMTG
ncbi:DMT family transporter [Paenibacillus alkaliterrae]|uniref:DMT family transporter n=1 Tax=Paenibacillus alkaliterrae TaxID=320909 RepID=UPI001F488F28|nr:DMT family transporter [Paenibacillus alkaliterrae]MCF2940009.1 DMT family transporter [Paenibacillus alkaliterrae]